MASMNWVVAYCGPLLGPTGPLYDQMNLVVQMNSVLVQRLRQIGARSHSFVDCIHFPLRVCALSGQIELRDRSGLRYLGASRPSCRSRRRSCSCLPLIDTAGDSSTLRIRQASGYRAAGAQTINRPSRRIRLTLPVHSKIVIAPSSLKAIQDDFRGRRRAVRQLPQRCGGCRKAVLPASHHLG